MVALNSLARQVRRGRSLPIGTMLLMAGFLLLAAAVAGCKGTGGRPMTAENMVPPVMLLAPGDVLDITFSSATNMSGVRRIGPEGSINMPIIGQVQASGKTVLELEAELIKSYSTELQFPELFVNLAGSANVVYVSGSVARPGRVMLERPLTALEAILEVGGFAPDANLERVTVIRYDGPDNTTYELNLEPVYSGGPVAPFYLQPRDVVNVPKKIQWF